MSKPNETYVKVEDGFLELRVRGEFANPKPSSSGKSELLFSNTLSLPDGSRVGINWYREKKG